MLSCRFIRIFVFLECLSFLIAKKVETSFLNMKKQRDALFLYKKNSFLEI